MPSKTIKHCHFKICFVWIGEEELAPPPSLADAHAYNCCCCRRLIFVDTKSNVCWLIGTWNVSEAGHGKGAPDGIGATVKRLADRLVLRGNDIPDAATMVAMLQPHTSIALYLVSKEEILERTQYLAKHALVAVPGTMSIHQLICTAPGTMTMYHRKLSCMCNRNTMCDCFAPTVFTFHDVGLPVLLLLFGRSRMIVGHHRLTDELFPAAAIFCSPYAL